MAEIADIGFRADTKELDRAADRLDKVSSRSKKTEKATDRLKRSFTGLATRAGAANKAMSAMSFGAARLGRAVGIALAGIGSALSLRKFIQGTTEADRVQSQLAASLASTNGASGQTVKTLNEAAAALQKVTKFGDEATNAAQGILLSFTRIQGDIFPKATIAVQNVATALQTDLKSAAIQVGKALNDPVIGMTALSRSGITFTEVQKKLVKEMVATGDIVGAQTLILKELEMQFGGSAKAARQNLGGALAGLKNAFGDLFELGKSASEPFRKSIERLIVAISNPAFMSFVQMLGGAMFGAMQVVTNALTVAANAIGFITTNVDFLKVGLIALLPLLIANFGPAMLSTIGQFVKLIAVGAVGAVRALTVALAANPLGLLVVAISAVIGYLVVFRDKITLIGGEMATLGDYGRAVWEVFLEGVQKVGDFIKERFTKIKNIIGGLFEKIAKWSGISFSSIVENVNNAKNSIKNVANTIAGLWFGAFKSIKTIWSKFPAVVGEAAIGAVNATVDAINWLIEKSVAGVNKLITAINNVPGIDMKGLMYEGVKNVENPFSGATSNLVGDVKGAFNDALAQDFIGAAGSTLTGLLRSPDALVKLGESLRTRANEIAALRNKVNDTGEAFDGVKPTIEILNNVGGAAGGAASKVSDLAKATKAAAEETAGFAKGVVRGAISDVRSALEDGKITVREWADVFLNALNKITDRLLNKVLDAMFQVSDAGTVGSGDSGGWIGKLIGSLFNAKGNVFNGGSRVQKYAAGGVVSSATSFGMSGGQVGVMGEAGPEGILPLTRTRGGDLGVKAEGMGGNSGVVVQIVDQRGADAPPVRQERSQMGDGRELRRFIIGAVKEATVNGELDGAQGARFGARPVKVLR